MLRSVKRIPTLCRHQQGIKSTVHFTLPTQLEERNPRRLKGILFYINISGYIIQLEVGDPDKQTGLRKVKHVPMGMRRGRVYVTQVVGKCSLYFYKDVQNDNSNSHTHMDKLLGQASGSVLRTVVRRTHNLPNEQNLFGWLVWDY